MKVFKRVPSSAPYVVSTDALLEELRVVREENARLRTQACRPGGVDGSTRTLVELHAETQRLVALQEATHRAADAADHAWQTLADALVVRDALVSVCDELIGISARLRRRLQSLGPSPSSSPPLSGDGVVAVARTAGETFRLNDTLDDPCVSTASVTLDRRDDEGAMMARGMMARGLGARPESLRSST